MKFFKLLEKILKVVISLLSNLILKSMLYIFRKYNEGMEISCVNPFRLSSFGDGVYFVNIEIVWNSILIKHDVLAFKPLIHYF